MENTRFQLRRFVDADLAELLELETVTFLDNPLMNYMGGVQQPLTNDPSDTGRTALKGFQSFMTQNVLLNGGHIDIILDTSCNPVKLVAGALWFAPGRHLTPGFSMIRAGLVSVLRKWGFSALPKIPEFQDQAQKVAREEFKRRNIPVSPDQAWYLQVISVHPEYQSKGLSSRLIREFIASHKETNVFTLEATHPKAKLRYDHLGFETLGEIVVGKGTVNAEGLPLTPEERKQGASPGVTCWSMIYVRKD